MKTTDVLLPLYDQEIANTRRILQCVPEGKNSWKPHEKSMTLGRLAGHVADLPHFLTVIIQTEGLELATSNLKPFEAAGQKDLLAGFEERAQEARAALAGCTDEHFAKSWKLTFKGKELFGGPRSRVVPTTIGHLIHHRGQLTVYLRLNGVVFPGVYGPSADEMAAFR